MKKIITLLLVGCHLATVAEAQNSLTLVQGILNRDKVQKMVLFDVQDGERIEYATSRLTKDNRFGFALPEIKKGFYYLSDQNRRNFIRLYLKPGDKINLQIDEENYDLVQSSPENTLLKKWADFSYPVTRMSIFPRHDTTTYRSFFPTLTAFLPKAAAFKKRINTPNPSFNILFKKSVDAEIEHAALKFLLTPNSVHPTRKEYPAYYSTILQPGKYADADLLQFGFATDLISLYTTYTYITGSRTEPSQKRTVLETTALFGNDKVKGVYAALQMGGYRTLEDFNTAMDPVKKYLTTDSMQARYFRILKKLSSYKKGDAAYNFSYPDVNGKQVSMQSLKGKVVLVDVWATWCGPCKVEIPHLKKLEEELKDQNIAFVSISVDEEKDKEKWLRFVTKEQLGGIQLYAKGWSDLTKFYDINGIPRFMVFDQDGKIVTVDSPRPSDPKLKELLLSVVEGKPLTIKTSNPVK